MLRSVIILRKECFAVSAAITFDTYAFVKKLKDAGMPEEQAKILAETHNELIEERLATKRDLKERETNLRHEMKEMERRLLIRLGGMMAASIAIVAALVKLP
ncbi:MAG: DUF1640 domain-containing protein [Nitrospirae bacterium]|nr:DUF1640 domain-containing protein [Magnetococcales bacterium]HAT50013.1 DUF1640 domain-containing protein [Alphaproteobacteria bacterium]